MYICFICKVEKPVISNTQSFPLSWLITGFVTRVTLRVPLVEQELPTLPEHMSSTQVFNGVRVAILSFLCSVLQIVVCSFVIFLLAIVLSVLRFTEYDYHFGIFKPFLSNDLHSGKEEADLKKYLFINDDVNNLIIMKRTLSF